MLIVLQKNKALPAEDQQLNSKYDKEQYWVLILRQTNTVPDRTVKLGDRRFKLE